MIESYVHRATIDVFHNSVVQEMVTIQRLMCVIIQ